jgi:hypothetical protein
VKTTLKHPPRSWTSRAQFSDCDRISQKWIACESSPTNEMPFERSKSNHKINKKVILITVTFCFQCFECLSSHKCCCSA